MKKILFVTRNFPPAKGGIETMAKQLLSHGLETKDLVITLCHFGQSKVNRENFSKFDGLEKYYHFPGTGRISTFFWSALLVPIIAWLKKPHLIVNMQITSALGSYFCCKLGGLPYIVIGLGLEVLHSDFKPYNFLRQKILINASKVISISRYTDSLISHYNVKEHKRQVIPLGTDPEWFYPKKVTKKDIFPWATKSDSFVCFSLCRLVKRKGMDTVIRAMEMLKEENIIYVIGGKGPDENRLKKLVKELNLEHKVFFAGPVDQNKLADYYSAADLFVHPSRSYKSPPEVEGFGIVFLEAGACETASIGSRSGGIPDAIIEGQTGLLIEPDDYEDLRGKILELYKNPERLKILGSNARKHVLENANWKKVSENYWKQFIAELH